MAAPIRSSIPRGLEFALFLTALAWVGAASAVASRAAQGIAFRFTMLSCEPLLEALFLLFLTVLGFRALDWIATRGAHAADTLALPCRATQAQEWGTGVALGWGLALAVVLPLLLSLHLHTHFHRLSAHDLLAVLVALATLAVAALAEEVIFRGYPFQRLIQAIGPTLASLLLSIGFAMMLLSANPPNHILFAVIDGTLLGLLLSLAWLRTHGLWLGWGLHFAYRAAMAVLIGLPIAGRTEFASLADTVASGPRWLSGGIFGPDAAVLTSLILLCGLAVLYRSTRNYAWDYTQPVIVGAGYEVAIAPPAAHLAMEQAAAPPPLVQILPSTPQTRSAAELTSRPDSYRN